jgi:hypothetical protein
MIWIIAIIVIWIIDILFYSFTPWAEREKYNKRLRQFILGSGIYMFIKWKLKTPRP